MIAKIFIADARVIYQEPDENEPANEAIMVHVDSGGTLVVQQRDAQIIIDRGTIPELIAVLKLHQVKPKKATR